MLNKYRLPLSLLIIVFLIFSCFNMIWSNPTPAMPSNTSQAVSDILSKLTLEEKIGQMLMVDFQETTISPELQKMIEEIKPGGLILYGGNILSPRQAIALTSQMQSASAIPMFIAVDQEGGTVSRLNGGTAMPAAVALGAARSSELAAQAGLVTGKELTALGINMNFAPVMDVLNEPDRASLGSRCFSSNPVIVSQMGQAFARGLENCGVIAGFKHFPGHGMASLDSHRDIPVAEADRSRLDIDLAPFKQVVNNNAELVMTAHVSYPALDSTKVFSKKTGQEIILPASLSAKVNTGLLRQEMGFKGVIVTDSLYMRPMREHFGSQEEAALMALKAGADLLLVQKDLLKVKQYLLQAVQNGKISEARIDESLQRLLQLKLNRGIISIANGSIIPGSTVMTSVTELNRQALAVVGCQEHRSLAQEIANQAVTLLIKNPTLPWKLQEGQNIVYFVPLESTKPAADAAFSALIAETGLKKISSQGFVYRTFSQPVNEHLRAIKQADYIVLLCRGDLLPLAANTPQPQRDFPLEITALAAKTGKPLVVLSSEAPRDEIFLSSVPVCFLTYGSSRANITSGLLAAFGIIKPSGHLPYSVYGPNNKLLFPIGYGLK